MIEQDGEIPTEFIWVLVGDDDYHPTEDEMDEIMDRFERAVRRLGIETDFMFTSDLVRPAKTADMDELADLVAEKVIERMDVDTDD